MLKIRIITDSSSGFTREEILKHNIHVLPLTLSSDNKDYLDGVDISTDDFYKMFFDNQQKRGLAKLDILGLFKKDEKDFPKTSMVKPQDFVNEYNKIIEEGYLPVVLCISRRLSGTYQSAIMAKDLMENDDIVVIDSQTALGSVKVLIKSVLQKEYENRDELINEIESLKKRINFYAVPETLAYLAKGGRLGKFSAKVGNLLHFKPIIQLDEEGILTPIDKPRGLKQAFREVNNCLKENPIDFDYPCEFGYSTKIENVNQLIESCKESLKGNYTTCQISPVVGAHVGPGASALFYVSKNEVNKKLLK